MKKTILILLTFLISFAEANAQVNPNYHSVKSYTRKDGTVVKGYKRTDPNSTNRDNYTTKPNVNPHTGERGYIEPDTKPLYNYSSPYINNYNPPTTNYNYNSTSNTTTTNTIDVFELQRELSKKYNDPEYLYRDKPTYEVNTTTYLREHHIDDSAIKAQIPKGSKVKVVNSFFREKWEIVYDGKKGWVNKKYLNFYEPSKKQETFNYPESTNSNSNDVFALQREMSRKYSDPEYLYKDKPVYSVTSQTNLKEHMSHQSATLTNVPKGAQVKVLNSFFREWWEVYYDGRKGYIQKELLSYGNSYTSQNEVSNYDNAYYEAKYSKIVTQKTSLREGPDSQSRVILRFDVGDEVSVIEDSGNWWWKIEYKGNIGWVKKALLK